MAGGRECAILRELQALRETTERIEARLAGGARAEGAWEAEVAAERRLRPARRYSCASVSRSASIGSDTIPAALPLNWPAALRVRPVPKADSSATLMAGWSGMVARTSSLPSPTDAATARGRIWIDPHSLGFMAYSAASLLMLLYDLTVIPYMLAWNLDYGSAPLMSGWYTPAFWTLDLCISFVTAFYYDGELVTDSRRMARKYLVGRFPLDAVIVLCDWTSFILAHGGLVSDTGAKVLRVSKLARLLRTVALTRVGRAMNIVERLAASYAMPDGVGLALGVLGFLLGIMWTAHLLACAWYVAGTVAYSDTGERWVDSVRNNGGQGSPLSDAPLQYQYMVAFSWAAGQIALGSLDVGPTNSSERAIFVLAMMLGFMFGSSVVSMLSTTMVDYRMRQKGKTRMMRMLRRYFRENSVSPHIAIPVQKQAEQQLACREPLAEGAVEALQLVSVALRSKLRFEIQRPHLLKHPAFRLWTSVNGCMMHRTCLEAVDFLHLRPQDDLLVPGFAMSTAFILVGGAITYRHTPPDSPHIAAEAQQVQMGQWICEAALWVEWTCVGKAETSASCQLLAVNSEALLRCLSDDPVLRHLAAEYGRQFHKRVTSARPPHTTWPTDLEVPFTDYLDLVVSMPAPVRTLIGLTALQDPSARRAGRAIDKLREEVEGSRSTVLVTGAGAVVRVVSLVVLRVEDGAGRIFTQLGRWDGQDVRPEVLLPALKQEADELVGETLDRMLATKALLLQGRLEFVGTMRETHEEESREFGVQTRYLRSLCAARLLVGEDSNDSLLQPRLEISEVRAPAPQYRRCSVRSLEVLQLLCDIEVHVVHVGGGAGYLYAWLRPEAMVALHAPGTEAVLRPWLSQHILRARRVDEEDFAI